MTLYLNHLSPSHRAIFLKYGMMKLLETLQTVLNVKMNIWQIKICNEINLFVFIIYSFIKFKVLVSFPKSFHGLLNYENALQLANWSNSIDNSSILFNKLTIQLVFNEI